MIFTNSVEGKPFVSNNTTKFTHKKEKREKDTQEDILVIKNCNVIAIAKLKMIYQNIYIVIKREVKRRY